MPPPVLDVEAPLGSAEASPLVTTDGKIALGPAAGSSAGGMLALVSYADLGIIVVKKILSE